MNSQSVLVESFPAPTSFEALFLAANWIEEAFKQQVDFSIWSIVAEEVSNREEHYWVVRVYYNQ